MIKVAAVKSSDGPRLAYHRFEDLQFTISGVLSVIPGIVGSVLDCYDFRYKGAIWTLKEFLRN
jgi:hypothetical protein